MTRPNRRRDRHPMLNTTTHRPTCALCGRHIQTRNITGHGLWTHPDSRLALAYRVGRCCHANDEQLTVAQLEQIELNLRERVPRLPLPGDRMA